MTDPFSTRADSVSAPAARARAVTPHDGNALPEIPKALYIGSGGAITMRGSGDSADSVWANVPSGSVLPFRPSHIRATGTTAGDILALS
ncbi:MULTISPECIES: spike base protein, RCAP_Rcc01079 family [Sphingomonas]|uniref:spike base protein, RCAP_Rcc01079 family n=1 Tax=Sphingomonas TaxID=13687 RepID=UPI00082EF4E8|nr:hypothetical protein [Sphingomonas sp. CCH10-B3]MBA3878932.1 hypothetical protein [Sphingobium sp.]